jgi:hypothetical protein
MIKTLHKMGIKSNHMYTAGLVSVVMAMGSWFLSNQYEAKAGIERADRWGIFIGEWAPTFFAMGIALRIEETHKPRRGEEYEHEEMMPGHRAPASAGIG